MNQKTLGIVLAVAIIVLLITFFSIVILHDNFRSVKFPHLSTPIMIVAGIPKTVAETNDYDTIFRELKEAGVEGFFPLFLYEETPVPQSTGHERDFVPPCRSDSPAFKAMRMNNVKYIVPGEILYASNDDLPTITEDPLRHLINCAGRKAILGVLSYDEPIFNSITPEQAEKLYRRVKEIDSTIPVFLVNAPLPATITENNTTRPITVEEVSWYFSEIRRYTKYADIMGFDVYPIPQRIAQTISPYRPVDEIADGQVVIADYLRWLKENSGNKPYFITLQAFSYKNLGPVWLNNSTDGAPWPTTPELQEMITVAKRGGASYIVWFGPSYLKTAEDELFWQKFLGVLRDSRVKVN